MARSIKVAVIGAGAAGLISARELKREGHEVVVYEKSDRVGGLWVYDPRVEEDLLGLDPNRQVIHSSLYRSVSTTIPREVMGFSDYPFRVRDRNGIARVFPGHEEVLEFLNNFAKDYGVIEAVRFNTEVVRVERQLTAEENNGRWIVGCRLKSGGMMVSSEELFDAVVVCSGHFTQPLLAELPGVEKWPGKQIHCHNYRTPEPFRNKVVLVIGGAMSSCEISLEISQVAKQVHISLRIPGIVSKELEMCRNVWKHPQVVYCYENGEIAFEDGTVIGADVIVHCTGYRYTFPFLKTNGAVTIDDNRVGPLYKHIFPPRLAPSLSFVGIPDRANHFLTMELQAKWIASVVSKKTSLPSEEDMLADVEEYYKNMSDKGIPKHQTHRLPLNQFEYLDWVAAQVGLPPVDDRTKEITTKVFSIIIEVWGIGYREKYIEATTKEGCINRDDA